MNEPDRSADGGIPGRTTARNRRARHAAALLLLPAGALLGACADATGPEFDSQLQLLLRADSPPASLPLPTSTAPGGEPVHAPVPAEAVGEITLQITGLEALPAGAPPGDPEAWAALGVSRPPVGVLTLPPGGIELAAGGFPAGHYVDARVYIPSAEVTLSTSAPVGDGTLPPGTYPASVPAGAEFGVDVANAVFTVPEAAQGTFVLVLDVGATLATLDWTGEFILVHPVLRAGD